MKVLVRGNSEIAEMASRHMRKIMNEQTKLKAKCYVCKSVLEIDGSDWSSNRTVKCPVCSCDIHYAEAFLENQIEEEKLTESKRKSLVEEVIDSFDFERVHKAYVALDWKWNIHAMTGGPNEYRTPTAEEIKTAARDLCFTAIEKKTVVSTGGLSATYEPKDGLTEERITLECIIERACTM